MTSFQNRRWVCLIAAMVICVCAGFGYAWSVLQNPIVEQFGWSDSGVALTYTIMVLCSTMTPLFFGSLIRRLSTRLVVVIGALLFGAGLFLTGEMARLWQLYLFYGIIAGLGVGFIYPSMMAYVVRLFPDRSGMASGLGTAAYGSGAILWAPTAAYLGLDPDSLEAALYDAALNLRTSEPGSADLCLPRVTVVGSYAEGNATCYLCTLHRTYYYDFLLLRGANQGGGADCAVFTVEDTGDGYTVTDAVDGGDGTSPGAFYQSQGAPADLCAQLDAAYEAEGMPVLLRTLPADELLPRYLSRCFFGPVTAENQNMEAAARTFVDGLPGTAPGEALTAAFGDNVWERLSLSFTQTRTASLRTAALDPDTGEEVPDGTPVCVTDGDEWRVDLTVDGTQAGHFSVTNATGPWTLSRGLVLDI